MCGRTCSRPSPSLPAGRRPDALPAAGAVSSGSIVLRRSPVVPPVVVHVKPVGAPHPDHGARHVVALVLIVEPGGQPRINPDLVATTLELTPSTGTCSGSTRSTPSRGRRTWCGWCCRSPNSGEVRTAEQK